MISCLVSALDVVSLLLWDSSFPPLVSSPHSLTRSQLRHRGGRSPRLSLWAAPSSLYSACKSLLLLLGLALVPTGALSVRRAQKLSRQETGGSQGSFLRGVSSLGGRCSALPVVQCLKFMVSFILPIVLVVSSGRVGESGPCYSILDGSEVPVFVFF